MFGEGILTEPNVALFITKHRSDGSTIYSTATFNGQSIPAGSSFLGQIAIDAQGDCYVLDAGDTLGSVPLQTTPGAFQTAPKADFSPWVVKLDGTGNVVYATYLGGSGADVPYSIAVDGAGNVYITGSTTSNDFPTKNA